MPIAPLLINIFGGSGGGAIKKNKLFYFINYEGRRDASAGSANRTVPSANLRAGNCRLPEQRRSGRSAFSRRRLQQIDPGGIGVNAAALKQMQAMPLPNNTTIGDAINTGAIPSTLPRTTSRTPIFRRSITTRTIRTRCSSAAIFRTIGRTAAPLNSPGFRRTP